MRSADSALPHAPAQALSLGGDGAWGSAVEALNGPVTITALTALIAALVAGVAVYHHMKAPSRARERNGRALMYVPLVLVNAAAVYGQVAYAYERIAPAVWNTPSKVALAVMFAAAIESIAVYVGWHAHDALLQKATATAARLRRASYFLAGLVGAINYAHFADGLLDPTAASIAFGLLSLLSPWLWGLHTRRAQHVRLTREGAVDATGATFSGERIRAFPIRSYMARRWSIDHYVTDPRAAWEGYNADLDRRRSVSPGTRARAAWMVLVGQADIEPGVVPTHPARTQPSLTLAPEPPTGSHDEKAAASHAASRAAKVAASAAAKAAANPDEHAEEKAGASVRRAVPLLADHPLDSVRRLARAYSRKPGGTNVELAKLAKVSVGTANRYLPEVRAAAAPAESPDDDQERAQAALTLTPFIAPRELVSATANGRPYPTGETA